MKLIIAGGRNYKFTAADIAKLDVLKSEVQEVVSGGAQGADGCGEEWATKNGIPFKRFTPEWDNIDHPKALLRKRKDGSLYDCSAGPRRNKEMAKYADAVALFPGGSGTANMRRQAINHGLAIYDIHANKYTPGTRQAATTPRV